MLTDLVNRKKKKWNRRSYKAHAITKKRHNKSLSVSTLGVNVCSFKEELTPSLISNFHLAVHCLPQD